MSSEPIGKITNVRMTPDGIRGDLLRDPFTENDVLMAVQWLARQYPKEWSQEAVCRWLANHPVVQKLLNDRLQEFVEKVALPNAKKRQAEVEAMRTGEKAKAV